MGLPSRLIFVCSVVLYAVGAIKVDDVHLSTNKPWVTGSPAHVICDVSLENESEGVARVSWYLHGELVYEWFFNETINVYGLLEERVDLPSNRTNNWNVKINRIAYELQGEFKCEAANNEGLSSSKAFEFIVYYNVGAEYEVVKSSQTTDCELKVELKMPALYPRPIVILCKMYSDGYESAAIRGFDKTTVNPDESYNYYFNATFWVGDYPLSSFLSCTDYIYGTKIELFTYHPVEEMPTCGEMPESLNQTFQLDRAASSLIAGCRNDLRKGSEAKYRCEQDSTVLFTSTCSQDGQWQPDLFDPQIALPKCGCGITGGSVGLILTAIFIIYKNQ